MGYVVNDIHRMEHSARLRVEMRLSGFGLVFSALFNSRNPVRRLGDLSPSVQFTGPVQWM